MNISMQGVGDRAYDLCIVGTGPAGLPLALETAKLNPNWQILLVEFGGDDDGPNELDDSIVIETPETHHLPSDCTNKGLGGTSLTWGGRCVSYDEIDFLPRNAIGDTCTWDVSIFKDVQHFYSKAADYLDCGDPKFRLDQIPALAGSHIAPGFKEGDVIDTALERWSMPTRLGAKYKDTIDAHPSIHLLKNTRALKLNADANSREIGSLTVKDRSTGTKYDVKAKTYAIAAGAQESTRLLLTSPEIFKGDGLPDSLGKYYQGHISGKIASIKFNGDPKKVDFGFLMDGEVYVRRRFQFPTQTLIDNDLLNTAIWLDNPLYYDPKHGNGTMSLIYLAMFLPVIGPKFAPPAIAHSVTKGKGLYKLGGHAKNILFGFPGSFIGAFQIFLGRYVAKRKVPGVYLFSPKNEYALHFHAEQQPVEQNRMYLAEDRETLRIYYSYTEKDVQSVIDCHELLDRSLRNSGVGELIYWYAQEEMAAILPTLSIDGVHQVGTTRMSMKQEDGVVDPDLKVWGTDNLYICSSSTFPTSGQANPTFLLTAFAMRLAKHLTTP